MKANIRGTEIYFDIAGMQFAPGENGLVERPVLFLLHGGPGGDHTRFKQHSLELQDYAQLVFIDHRGCGRSKRTKRKDYTLENNIEDIEALRQHLGLPRICLLGTSYGGMVAQGYAIRYGKHLDKLILNVTAPSFRFIEQAKQYIQQHATAEQIAMCETLWNGKFKNSAHVIQFFRMTDSLYSIKARKNPKTSHRNETVYSYDALNEGFSNFLQTFDFIPQLKKIKCPTLILAGKEDWICSPEQAKTIARHIPNSQLKIFNNCGHAIAVDAHEKYIKAIQQFLKVKG